MLLTPLPRARECRVRRAARGTVRNDCACLAVGHDNPLNLGTQAHLAARSLRSRPAPRPSPSTSIIRSYLVSENQGSGEDEDGTLELV